MVTAHRQAANSSSVIIHKCAAPAGDPQSLPVLGGGWRWCQMALVPSGRSAEWEQCQKHPKQDKTLIFPQPNKWSHFCQNQMAASYPCATGSALPARGARTGCPHGVERTRISAPLLTLTPSVSPSFSSRAHSSLLSGCTVVNVSLFQNNHGTSSSRFFINSSFRPSSSVLV